MLRCSTFFHRTNSHLTHHLSEWSIPSSVLGKSTTVGWGAGAGTLQTKWVSRLSWQDWPMSWPSECRGEGRREGALQTEWLKVGSHGGDDWCPDRARAGSLETEWSTPSSVLDKSTTMATKFRIACSVPLDFLSVYTCDFWCDFAYKMRLILPCMGAFSWSIAWIIIIIWWHPSFQILLTWRYLVPVLRDLKPMQGRLGQVLYARSYV